MDPRIVLISRLYLSWHSLVIDAIYALINRTPFLGAMLDNVQSILARLHQPLASPIGKVYYKFVERLAARPRASTKPKSWELELDDKLLGWPR